MDEQMNTDYLELASSTLADIIPALALRLLKPVTQKKSILTPIQVNTLNSLMRDGQHTMSQLAAKNNISSQQMTAVINQLDSKHYILRKHDKTDHRIVQVTISAAGKRALESHTNTIIRSIQTQLNGLSEDECEKLYHILTELREMIEIINNSDPETCK